MKVLSLTTSDWRSFYRVQERALQSVGVDVETLAVPGDHRSDDTGVTTRGIADYVRYLPEVLRAAGSDFDLVHANYGLTAPYALAARDLPSVLTLWGGEFTDNPFAPLVRAATSRVDSVVVPSEPMAGRVDRDCHLIPFPVDTERFAPMPRAAARRELGWPLDERIVLFPYATAREEKNFPLARRVVDRSPVDATLRTVSNEPYHRVPLYLNASDLVLITSRHESGPMVAKEATACNVPVVSTDVGFVASVLEGVENAHVADGEDALVDAVTAVLRDGGRADGRDGLREYGEEAMGRRLLAAYERTLA